MPKPIADITLISRRKPRQLDILWDDPSPLYITGNVMLPSGAVAWVDLGRKRIRAQQLLDGTFLDEETYGSLRVIVGPPADWQPVDGQLFRLPAALSSWREKTFAIDDDGVVLCRLEVATVPRMPVFDAGIKPARPYYNMEILAARISTEKTDTVFQSVNGITQAELDDWRNRQDA